ncbi:MAG TPA: hypothetical protein VMW01_07970 [Williamwhitmania sp.]|jgi:hypothetical protein|nr:hypothetical protein [Williamwhitmania sp.]
MKTLMRIFLIATIIFAGNSTKIVAQDNQNKAELVKAQKIAFFTQKLNLTPDEAQRFWPVYNEYWSRKNIIIADRRETMAYCQKNLSRMSSKEIKAYADKYVGFQKKEADLLLEFNLKFQKVLPVEKVMKLYQADNDFKNWLLQQIKEGGKDN